MNSKKNWISKNNVIEFNLVINPHYSSLCNQMLNASQMKSMGFLYAFFM